jgi:hypothetical protein
MRLLSRCAPAPTRAGEELLPQRIEDDPVLHAAAHAARNGDREHRKAVDEVRGAVERIDDPLRVALAAAAAFLGEDRVTRIRLADDLDDLALGGPVDVGDEVVAALGRHLEAVEPRHAADDELARAARGAYRDVEKCVHDHLA